MPPGGGGGEGRLTLGVRLKGGRLMTKVLVDTRGWRILGQEQPLCGDTEAWEFGE